MQTRQEVLRSSIIAKVREKAALIADQLICGGGWGSGELKIVIQDFQIESVEATARSTEKMKVDRRQPTE